MKKKIINKVKNLKLKKVNVKAIKDKSLSKLKNVKFVSSIISLMVLMFVVDSIFFGVFLWGDYNVGDDNIWRARNGLLKHIIPAIGFYFAIALVIALLFKDYVVKSNRKVMLFNFLKAGLLIGLLIGVIFSTFYIIFPINTDVVSAWFGGSVIFGIVAGFILYVFNRKSS